MSARDEYVRRMKAQMDAWNAEIDVLTVKAAGMATEVKKDIQEQIESLKSKQDIARLRISELQQAGESAMGDLRSGVELSLAAMGEAIDSARSRFK